MDVLQDLVNGYNNSYHRSIKRTPASVNKENEVQVWVQQYLPKKSSRVKTVKFKFKKGDLVQVSQARNVFSSGFGQTFTEEIFHVRRRFATNPVTFMLEDLQKEKIAGWFYEPEMNNKEEDLVFCVEKV